MNRHFVDYNARAPEFAAMSEPAKTPSEIAAELAASRAAAQAADAKAYAGMTPPAPPKAREPAYQSADFAFQYSGPKGTSGEVIPKRREWPFPDPVESQAPEAPLGTLWQPAGATKPDDVKPVPMGYQPLARCLIGGIVHRQMAPGKAVPAGVIPALVNHQTWVPLESGEQGPIGTIAVRNVTVREDEAPTEWQSGPPPSVGWRAVRRNDMDCGACYALWNGDRYTRFATGPNARGHSTNLVRLYPDATGGGTWLTPAGEVHALWRGPRLVGPDWPEPEAS